MRVIIQRVLQAAVDVGNRNVSKIGRGLLVLVGIHKDDKPEDAATMCRKILNIRLFENDENKPWSKSVVEKNFEILLVSQFTLFAKLKGTKPDFHEAMPAAQSKDFYTRFVDQLRKQYKPELVKDGEFGAIMKVSLINDGPVTIQLDSRKDDDD
jgi:D-tyrosyl-tRNA(Tyr) deacylase